MKKSLLITLALITLALLGIFLFNVCNSSLKEATLTVGSENIVEMDNIKYIVDKDTISKDNLDGKIGKVKKFVTVGSPDPKGYKNATNIYKIKDKKIEDQVALEWNGSFYLLKPFKK